MIGLEGSKRNELGLRIRLCSVHVPHALCCTSGNHVACLSCCLSHLGIFQHAVYTMCHDSLSLCCFLLMLVAVSLSLCVRRLFNSAAERVMNRLRVRLFSHLATQEIGFFDRVRTGELMNRLSEVWLPCHDNTSDSTEHAMHTLGFAT